MPFSFRPSAPSRDAKPSVQLPDRSGRAANLQPRSHWQPAKQYGQPDARHDGPVPSNAVLSGIVMTRRCHIHISGLEMEREHPVNFVMNFMNDICWY